MLRSTGVAVFRSPFHFFYCQTYRGGLSIYRKFRVKISTRSAYLFGASIIRGAFGRHIRNYIRAIIFYFHAFALFIFHCCALLFGSFVGSLPGVYPVGFLFGISTRCISTLEPGNILPKNSAIARTSFGTSNASGFLCSGQIPRTGQLSQSSFRTTSPGLSASLNPCQLSLRADASAKFSIASTATFANM